MLVRDIYSVDVLVVLGVFGLIGGFLGGKNVGSRLFSTLVAWLILIAVWPVVLAVMLFVAAIPAGIYSSITRVEFSDAAHSFLAKGFAFGGMLAVYGKIVWEAMHSPEIPHGRYVASAPTTPFTKSRWK